MPPPSVTIMTLLPSTGSFAARALQPSMISSYPESSIIEAFLKAAL